ncbi:MAG: adenylate/guanylate cyclase domain-containing protein, partial [Pseudomonadales bacterium]
AKEIDFATSLISGPHAQSNLARLFRSVQRNPDRDAARMIDFEHYRPSQGAPAMFVAVPVFAKGRPVAVLAVQESTAALNRVVTGGQQWERDGLGKTGETAIIGPDFTLRAASRFLIEDREGYVADQRAIATSEDTIKRILRQDSPILEQEVRTLAAEQALRGQTNTGVLIDYRGHEILGSWAPLKLGELNWAIVGKMDLSEAYAPIYQLARDTLIRTIVILGIITLAVMLLASSFVRPINDLIARVRRFGAGEEDVEFNDEADDEIGDLANSFRELVQSARKQTRLIEEVSSENERLLSDMLPRRIAQQVKQSSEDLVETVPDVSVLFAETRGLVEVTYENSASRSIEILKRIVSTADAIGEKHGVERIKTMGDTYMAAVGLSSPALDHMRRAVVFAGEMRSAVAQIGAEYEVQLDLRVGISAGSVVTDVVHHNELLFHLWGEAVVQADHALDRATNNQIIVTQPVHEKLTQGFRFERLEGGPIPLWCLQEG